VAKCHSPPTALAEVQGPVASTIIQVSAAYGVDGANTVRFWAFFEPLLDAVPPIRQCAGRPRKHPAKLHADKG
jgi:hypothetical protein